jgi:hypothetical protein
MSQPPVPTDRTFRAVWVLMIVSAVLGAVAAVGGLALFIVVSFDGWSPVQLWLLGGSLVMASTTISSLRTLRKLRQTGRL